MKIRIHFLALLLILQGCDLFAPVDPIPPAVTTDAASNVQPTGFTVQGTIIAPSFKNTRQEKKSGDIQEYGFILRRGSNSDTIKKGTSLSASPLTFEHIFTGLAGSTTYSVQAYAKNEGGGIAQGTAVDVTTGVPIPASGTFSYKLAKAVSAAYLNDPGLNNNPKAIVILTFNASGASSPQPLALTYDSNRWAVINQNGSTLPVNSEYNIYYTTPGDRAFSHTAAAGNTSGHVTTLDHPLLNDKPNARMMATKVLRSGGTSNTSPIGVYYSGGRWRIFNQNTSRPMTAGTEFNVIIDDRIFETSAPAASKSNSFNISPSPKKEAKVFITQYWKGVYNPSEVGISYFSITGRGTFWFIENQDKSSIPANSSYFVLAL
ncbi:DUF7452 domain-containing protein [Persicitalea jodogahamensis]|uniref:DUF7452 domain-containing protein n=1 Tax=Persicitalea jodogahamensis TaxID=402147 RepID=A0A8J3D4N6_9BACT|nr:hypothetical protein [Persicitalea jodogahamensis]GHB52054.1 hypothetical protein GCM10007390_00830 [Persicitalea jodogahamensis]